MSIAGVISPQCPPLEQEILRVLLVEDNEADVRLAEESLLEEGQDHVRITHVDRLSSAIQRLASEKIDVILLDLSLPDGEGLDGSTQIHTAYPHLPLVVLSGDQDESLALKALEQSAQDYLRKGEGLKGELWSVRFGMQLNGKGPKTDCLTWPHTIP